MAAASGLALLAAHPPLGWWWLSFLHPALLVTSLWMERRDPADGSRPWRRFRLGLLAGLVAFAPLLLWLMAPAGMLGWGLLVLTQAVWMGLVALLLGPFLDRPWVPVVAALAWTGIDAWRAVLPLNGFEWGAISYAHADGSWLLPVARLTGARGITFLVGLISVAAALTVRVIVEEVRARDGGTLEAPLLRTRVPAALMVGGLLVSVVATIEPPATDGSLDVLVVQGNDIRHWEQDVDDAPAYIADNLREETRRAVGDGPRPDITVWPESGIDRDPGSPRGASLQPAIDDGARIGGELITGVTLDGPDPSSERFVSAVQYDAQGQEVDRYVKRRLVPFGEYVPARALLDWIPALDQVPRDTLPGGGEQQLTTLDGVSLAVAICFETLFGDIVRDNVLAGDEPAGLILAVTNDASFRDSAEPAQHLAQSRLRAVETGRWVVHGALSGASAFVDPDGEIHQRTPVFTQTSIRTDVPLATGLTPYLVIGDVLGWVARAAVLLLGLWAALGTRVRRRLATSEQDGRHADTSGAQGQGLPAALEP